MTVTPMTIVQISDLHLDPENADHAASMAAVRERVTEIAPQFVVLTGDLTEDGFCRDGLFEGVRDHLERFSAPVLTIPGNHDVGDRRGSRNEIEAGRLARWNGVFERDFFGVEQDGWSLLGINSQLLGSGMAEERRQFEWLDERLDQSGRDGRQVALFLHAAPFVLDPDESLSGPSRYWGFDSKSRRALMSRIDRPEVRLVSNGHLHWYRAFERNDTLHVWCPSTRFIVDDAIFPRGGRTLGLVRYELTGDGARHEMVPLDLPADVVLFSRRTVEIPDAEPVTMAELVLDFTGTLSRDGKLLDGVASRLKDLARRIRITVMTADTFGTARGALEGLPVDVRMVETGTDKRGYVEQIGPNTTVAIGNGRNDVEMVEASAIGIAVIGPEGANGSLLRRADVVTQDVRDALDLVANPLRLKATLRK